MRVMLLRDGVSRVGWGIGVALGLLLAPALATANPALKGYLPYEALAERIGKLNEHPRARVTSLGQTLGEREIWLITLGTDPWDDKPALLIVGDVVPGEVIGSELVIRMAEQLLARAAEDEAVQKLLAERTIYLIPRPSPDASEKCFARPFREPRGNATPTDDDRDGEEGEDPPRDLDGDDWITMLRIEDPAGEYIPHAQDPRVMIKAELLMQERGKYRLLVEGRDQDGDEAIGEDAGDGVNFNRNFTFNYPAFKPHAGPHQVSEIETRAVADFCFDRPNIALVWTMTPEDNLLQPWKHDAAKDRARIRTTVHSDDARYYNVLSRKYQKLLDAKSPPASPDGEGSFSQWAYYHYGRWSIATRAWWIPPVEVPAKNGDEPEAKKSDDKRGLDDLNALRYFAEQKFEGFVDWKPIDHPDFPGQKVEVGGFKPFYRTHPPIDQVEGLAAKRLEFLMETTSLAPRLAIAEAKAEPLGAGVVRLTVKVANEGFMPTFSEMGQVSKQIYPVQVTWNLPEETVWLKGFPRTRIERISIDSPLERTWLVRLPEPPPPELTVIVSAPAVGSAEATVPLAPPAP